MRRLRSSLGLLGQLFAILLLAVIVEFGASTILYERAGTFSVRDDEARRLAEHLVIARKLVTERPSAERPKIARELTTDRYDVLWTGSGPPHVAPEPDLDEMRRQILQWEPALVRSDLRLNLVSTRRATVVTGSLRLTDGSWLLFTAHGIVRGWTLALGRIALALLPALALLIVGGLLIRRTLRPIRKLAEATKRIGSGDHPPVIETGTIEVRNLIHAFNEMQLRIGRLIRDRTQALAAVGHDIRTPLARLELRLDEIDRPDVREAVANDIAEMDAMVGSLLAFLKGEDDPEARTMIDLAVLMATIVDEAADRGCDATYVGPDHLETRLRPVAMRRVLGNLVENAIHYGGSAKVTLGGGPDTIVIHVEDDGPGIPDDRLRDVLEPFIRLDDARARNTQGLGLGLAIVTRAVEREGGALSLSNRARGGLRAEISLPRG